MTSRWEGVPLDIVKQQFQYLDNPQQIEAFCGDPHIYSKLCEDPNSEMWQYLLNRDFSGKITLEDSESKRFDFVPKSETFKDRYLSERNKFDHLKTDGKKLQYISEHGYTHLLKYIDISKISQNLLDKALYIAAQNNNLDIVRYLVERGAKNTLAFRWATEKGYLPIIQFLYENVELGHGAINSNTVIGEGFATAAGRGDLNTVKYLLNVHPSLIDYRKALARAITWSRLPVIKFLVENGMDVDQTIRFYFDPFGTPIPPNVRIFLDNLARSEPTEPKPVAKTTTEISKVTKSPKRITPKIPKSAKISKSPKTTTSQDTSTKCIGTTKAGTQCCRKAEDRSQYCFQHK